MSQRSCTVCGCTEVNACTDELRGACWWIEETLPGRDLCSHCAQPDARRGLALIAAAQLSDVVAELLRFAREGDQESFAPFALDPAENTADALAKILRITHSSDAVPVAGENNEYGALLTAIANFNEGWA